MLLPLAEEKFGLTSSNGTNTKAFVLVPLLEVKPNFSSASGKSITDLLAKCSDQGIVKL